jgi:general secretion pathway protein M
LAVVAYVGVVIALLAISLLLVADLRDKAVEMAAAQIRLDQLSERSRQSLSAPIASNAGVSGSPFLDGRTMTIAGATLQQRVEAAVTKAGGALMSSQVELAGPDAKNGFVGLTASMESSAGCADDPLRHRGRNAIPIRGQTFINRLRFWEPAGACG